jgi:hypothetical protein
MQPPPPFSVSAAVAVAVVLVTLLLAPAVTERRIECDDTKPAATAEPEPVATAIDDEGSGAVWVVGVGPWNSIEWTLPLAAIPAVSAADRAASAARSARNDRQSLDHEKESGERGAAFRRADSELLRLLHTHVAAAPAGAHRGAVFLVAPACWFADSAGRARHLVALGFAYHHSDGVDDDATRTCTYCLANGNEIPAHATWQGAVTVLVVDPSGTRALFARHRSRPERLTLLTGTANVGEMPQHTAAREATEEAGFVPPLDATTAAFLGLWFNPKVFFWA